MLAIMKMVKSVFFSFLLNQAGNGRSSGNSDHSIASAGGPIPVDRRLHGCPSISGRHYFRGRRCGAPFGKRPRHGIDSAVIATVHHCHFLARTRTANSPERDFHARAGFE
jgi:hypothetical protein